MLAAGHVDGLASDHHGRESRSTSLRVGWDRLAEAGHTAIADLLTSANPGALLKGKPVEPVPGTDLSSPLVKRLRRMVRGGSE
jgi:hypothetical protein